MKVVEASVNEPIQNIIDRAGIVTTRVGDPRSLDAMWTYEGKTIGRPWAHKAEEVMLREFGIEVNYIDDPTRGK